MPEVIVYLLIGLFIFTINAIPAFMPPTWMILAFFFINFDLHLLPLVIVGAISATCGRIVLALFSRYFAKRLFPEKWFRNYDDLGYFFRKHSGLTVPVVVAYAFSPIPSNQVFIIAGLADLNLKLIAFSFLAGRLISYTFWISVANRVVENLQVVFMNHLTNINTLAIEAVSFSLVIIIGKINWRSILKIHPRDVKSPDD
jgi:membrane protein YqaA with SNARE-associated domain